MHHAALSLLIGFVLLSLSSSRALALPFDDVVSIGDSLINLFGQDRGPVVPENIAARLGARWTNIENTERGLITTENVVVDGLHTKAAAQFGVGDLAVLWYGGNDFVEHSPEIAVGDISWMDDSAADFELVVSTLRGAGMDVVVLNLYDSNHTPAGMAQIPPGFEAAIRDLSVEWNRRLGDIATTQGAALVDIFALFDAIYDDPTNFSVAGIDPVLGPATQCPTCLFFDQTHLMPFAQGLATNTAIDALNAFYDPSGVMPLSRLSQPELAALAGVPEPRSALLLSTGLALFTVLRRCRVAFPGNRPAAGR